MITIYPVKGNLQLVLDDDGELIRTERRGGIELEACRLGEALRRFEGIAKCRITPYDGSFAEAPFKPGEPPKYFVFSDAEDEHERLIDIHVRRDGMMICPKQDLDFALQDGDEVSMGSLAC